MSKPNDLAVLVARALKLNISDTLRAALLLAEKGEFDLAETFARLAADKLAAKRLAEAQR